MNKTILIKTDGYSIEHSFFKGYEEAKEEMDRQYNELTPSEWIEDFEEISECNAYGAALYRNGEDVFIWKIVDIQEDSIKSKGDENTVLRFKVKMTFFESPNFSLTSQGETVELARFKSKEDAEMFARSYALEILRYYYSPELRDFNECNGDFRADFDGEDFCVIRFGEYSANIFNIIELCPNCGCDATDEPYALAQNTHCPQCGYIY